MERTRDLKLNCPLGTLLGKFLHTFVNSILLACYNNLTGAVVVGNFSSVDLLYSLLDRLLRKSDDSRHRTLTCRNEGTHEVTSDPRKPYRIGESHSARRYECAVFTERETGSDIRLNAQVLDSFCHDGASRYETGLCVLRYMDILILFKEDLLHIKTGSSRRLFDHVLCPVVLLHEVLSHSDFLNALSRINECNLHLQQISFAFLRSLLASFIMVSMMSLTGLISLTIPAI